MIYLAIPVIFYWFICAIVMLFIPEDQKKDLVKEVFITRTGKVYHKKNCRKIKYGISISLRQALNQGYSACSNCGGYTTHREEQAKFIAKIICAILLVLLWILGALS